MNYFSLHKMKLILEQMPPLHFSVQKKVGGHIFGSLQYSTLKCTTPILSLTLASYTLYGQHTVHWISLESYEWCACRYWYLPSAFVAFSLFLWFWAWRDEMEAWDFLSWLSTMSFSTFRMRRISCSLCSQFKPGSAEVTCMYMTSWWKSVTTWW